jgi:hypothetical protein
MKTSRSIIVGKWFPIRNQFGKNASQKVEHTLWDQVWNQVWNQAAAMPIDEVWNQSRDEIDEN